MCENSVSISLGSNSSIIHENYWDIQFSRLQNDVNLSKETLFALGNLPRCLLVNTSSNKYVTGKHLLDAYDISNDSNTNTNESISKIPNRNYYELPIHQHSFSSFFSGLANTSEFNISNECNEIIDNIRYEVEKCDFFGDLSIFVDTNTSFSGLSCSLVEQFHDDISENTPITMFTIQNELLESSLNSALMYSCMDDYVSMCIPLSLDTMKAIPTSNNVNRLCASAICRISQAKSNSFNNLSCKYLSQLMTSNSQFPIAFLEASSLESISKNFKINTVSPSYQVNSFLSSISIENNSMQNLNLNSIENKKIFSNVLFGYDTTLIDINKKLHSSTYNSSYFISSLCTINDYRSQLDSYDEFDMVACCASNSVYFYLDKLLNDYQKFATKIETKTMLTKLGISPDENDEHFENLFSLRDKYI